MVLDLQLFLFQNNILVTLSVDYLISCMYKEYLEQFCIYYREECSKVSNVTKKLLKPHTQLDVGIVSCPVHARLQVRKGMVNEVEFLGLIPQN